MKAGSCQVEALRSRLCDAGGAEAAEGTGVLPASSSRREGAAPLVLGGGGGWRAQTPVSGV